MREKLIDPPLILFTVSVIIVSVLQGGGWSAGFLGGIAVCMWITKFTDLHMRRWMRKQRAKSDKRDSYEVIHAALGYLLDEGHAADIGGYGPTWVEDKTGVTETELELAARALSERGYL